MNDLVKLNDKPKRRIIVFIDIPKENQTKEYLTNLFKTNQLDTKIIKIEIRNEIFFVYFPDENTTLEVFKWLEKYREEKVNILFNLEINIQFVYQSRKFKERAQFRRSRINRELYHQYNS